MMTGRSAGGHCWPRFLSRLRTRVQCTRSECTPMPHRREVRRAMARINPKAVLRELMDEALALQEVKRNPDPVTTEEEMKIGAWSGRASRFSVTPTEPAASYETNRRWRKANSGAVITSAWGICKSSPGTCCAALLAKPMQVYVLTGFVVADGWTVDGSAGILVAAPPKLLRWRTAVRKRFDDIMSDSVFRHPGNTQPSNARLGAVRGPASPPMYRRAS